MTSPRPGPAIETNRILCADCIEATTDLPDDSIDLVTFSPPYDGIRDYTAGWTLDLPALGKHLYRIVKEGGICAVVIGDGTKNFAKSLTSFRLVLDWCDGAGWRLFETCVYHRNGNPGGWWKTRFRVDHEYIFLFLKGPKPKTFDKTLLKVPSKHAGKVYTGTDRLTNGGFKKIDPKPVNPMKCRGTVWRYATSNSERNPMKLKHPATFPDKLAADIVTCFSKPGDLVLDPMCGSGTTCVAAARLGRRYIGIDIDPGYCRIAEERLGVEIPMPGLIAGGETP